MKTVCVRSEWVGFFIMIFLFGALAGCPKKEELIVEEPVVVESPDVSEAEAEAARAKALEEEKARQAEEDRLRQLDIEKARRIEAEKKQQLRDAFESRDIHFEFDKYALTPEARAILQEKYSYLMDNPAVEILIEGHCDERGTIEYNVALGDRRAKSARDYLVRLGVDPMRIETISYGEEMPLDPEHNEQSWARNRRGHFVITGD